MILGTNDQNTCLEYEQVLPFLPNATLGKVFPKGEMKWGHDLEKTANCYH